METNKAVGSFLGLACGDALGRPVEFKSQKQIQKIHNGNVTEMLANGTYNKPAGTITDDTDQALAIARSISETGQFDPDDIAARFVDWYRSGPFDIGLTTGASIRKLAAGVPWQKASSAVLEERGKGSGAGNGSVMRSAPVAIAFANASTQRLAESSRVSSQITHADKRCMDGAAVLNIAIAGHLTGVENPFDNAYEWLEQNHDSESVELLERLETVKNSPRPSDSLPNGGYVVDTLETSFTIARRASNAEEAIIEAVNLGGDTDTIGAVVGSLVGAEYGSENLPEKWVNTIDESNEIEELATELATTTYE